MSCMFVHSLVIFTPKDPDFLVRPPNNEKSLNDTGDDEDCRKNFDCYSRGDKIGINVWLIVISLPVRYHCHRTTI